MKFTNPRYNLDSNNNIFLLRKKEYDRLESYIKEIINNIPQECGFSLEEFEIKEVKEDKFDLMPTKKGEICLKLKKNKKIIDLSTYFPLLIDDQYILINGLKKVPLFQCFDVPVIRNSNIKIRTNIGKSIFISSNLKKDLERVALQFGGVSPPLALVFLAKYGLEKAKEFLDTKYFSDSDDDFYKNFILDLEDYYKSSSDFTIEDFIEDLGIRISRGGDYKKTGTEYLFKLDMILKIDIFTKRFFESDDIIYEIVNNVLKIEKSDCADLRNKRIRFIEYFIVAPIIQMIYEFCCINHDIDKPKFNISKNNILNNLNVSEIIQFDFSYNPIEEITKISRMSLLGPGGFKRENTPTVLRDLHNSHYGRICPIDTPDRDNCGIITSILPSLPLDENLKFTEDISPQIVSPAISMIPFLEKDDPTRLQMASSQMRQSILLEKFEKPMIRGCSDIYSKYTQFIKTAKENGIICKIEPSYMVVLYDSGEIEIIDISIRQIYSSNIDYYKICVNEGDKVKRGDILVESQFMQDGEIVFGNNFYVGIMPYYGYNYEDGIVISDETAKRMTSILGADLSFILPPDKILLNLGLYRDDDNVGHYTPLPLSLYDFYKKIEKLKREYDDKLKTISDPKEIENLNKNFSRQLSILEEQKNISFGPTNPYAIIQDDCLFKESKKLYSPNQGTRIAKITLYANKWYKDKFPQFSNWVERKLIEQQEEEREFINKLSEFADKEQLKKLIKKYNLNKFQLTIEDGEIVQKNKFKIKNEINGIYFDIIGLYRRPMKVGDKIGNRHGNKGVIAKIIPKEKMPIINGKNLDIIINPLGIISRMNLGQLYELHLSASLYDLKKEILKRLSKNVDQDEIKKYIIDYIKIIDNTENNWYYDQFKQQLSDILIDEKWVLDDFTIIQPPFESISYEKLVEAMEYTNTPMERNFYDPINLQLSNNEIAYGFMYFYRIIHMAEDKLAYRSIGNTYRKTLQPARGKKNNGGQRLGEMEVASLISHDALINLQECLTLKSDNIELKNEWLKKTMVVNSEFFEDSDGKIESIRLLESYLKVLGIEY